MSASRDYHNKNIVSKDALKVCVTQLESAAQILKKNKEGMTPEVLKLWNDKILQLSKDVSSTRNKSDMTVEVLENIVGNKRNVDQVEAEGALKARVVEGINQICARFDVNNDTNVKNIVNLLKPADNSDSEDFEIVDEGFKQTDTLCPVTKMVYKDAVKSSNCSHKLSKESFNLVLSNKASVKCPIAGCNKLWTRATTSADDIYQLKVDRFLRLQSMTAVSSSQFATVIDDDEYTDL